MPKFLYLPELGRVYPDWPGPGGVRGIEGVPGGDPVEMEQAPPDGRWAEVLPEKQEKPAKKSVKATGEGPAEKEN